MNFALRFLMIVSLFSALVLTGCGDDERLRQVETDREQLANQLVQQSGEINQALSQLEAENEKLRDAVSRQGAALDNLKFAIRDLQKDATDAQAKIAAERAAADANRGFRLWQWLIIILVVLIVIFIVYKLLKPRPFEEDEDEDFSSFDEDFGFDEEEDLGTDASRRGEDPKA